MKENENILNRFFNLRQEDLIDEMGKDRENLKHLLKQINISQIDDIIDGLPKEYNYIKNELYQKIENLIGDYEIKMAYYNKKYYKQGFYDAIMINNKCKKKYF